MTVVVTVLVMMVVVAVAMVGDIVVVMAVVLALAVIGTVVRVTAVGSCGDRGGIFILMWKRTIQPVQYSCLASMRVATVVLDSSVSFPYDAGMQQRRLWPGWWRLLLAHLHHRPDYGL
jgi:hypothetical protein